ncbi:MAG: M23 family metallopeptidase [Rhodocyclaceae bacterium]|nr:M23 family metallopeptidase [Rhodocyclaceae bacterium]
MRAVEPEILAQSKSLIRTRTGVALVGTALSLAVVSALATVPGQSQAPAQPRLVTSPISLSPAVVADGGKAPFVRIERIRAGDTLGTVLARLDTSSSDVISAIAASAEGKSVLRSLRAGRALSAAIDADGTLQAIDIPRSDGTVYRLERQNGELSVADAPPGTGSVTRMSSGTITSSLFAAADEAGLPDAATMKLAELFGTEIDFHTDLRKGDSFSVLYEARTRNGAVVGVEEILAAEFINRGHRYAVVYFEDADGNGGYYTPEGRNLKQAFLRSPLEFSRVTSGFKMRFHPIKKAWRKHTGVDFGASQGTAIKATSNGRVQFVGTKGGYGKTVILRHRNNISTLYAHMSGFASSVRPGQPVSQGDVIGYVGSTGWATGPHLHYEFRKSDQPVDPMSVTLPEAEPLEKRDLSRFLALAEQRLARLAMLNYQPLAASEQD